MSKYMYVIDLDERGYFSAHVTDAETEQEIIFEFNNDDSEDGQLWLVEDGFIKHTKDFNGLFHYLVYMDILSEDDELMFRG